jgi:adenosine deaminase
MILGAAERPQSVMRQFLQSVPKAELHVHLRGAMPGTYFEQLLAKHPAPAILDRAPARHVDLFRGCGHLRPFFETPAQARAADLFGYRSFQEFLISFLFTSYFFRDIADLQGLIQAVRGELLSQNIVYAEITVSVAEYRNQGLPLAGILGALDEAANIPPLKIRWIVDLVRDFGADAALGLLREIVALRPASVAGITLGGAEHRFPPGLFSGVYRLARDHGLRLTVHAGEAVGPESVWEALNMLGVERIGHGVRAIEDDKLVAHLAERQVPLEISPTSNLRTGIYPSYEAHPVRALRQAGVAININTDDPSFFGTTLVKEYEHLLESGLSEDDVLTFIQNGFRHAFLAAEEKQAYLEALEREWKAHRAGVRPL